MSYRLTEETAFIRILFYGKISAHDLQGAMRELEILETGKACVPNRLIDLTGVEQSEVKADDIHAAATKRKSSRFANAFRSAIVAPRAAQFGYSRMFQALNDHPDITIQVFPNTAEASAWLAEEPTVS